MFGSWLTPQLDYAALSGRVTVDSSSSPLTTPVLCSFATFVAPAPPVYFLLPLLSLVLDALDLYLCRLVHLSVLAG